MGTTSNAVGQQWRIAKGEGRAPNEVEEGPSHREPNMAERPSWSPQLLHGRLDDGHGQKDPKAGGALRRPWGPPSSKASPNAQRILAASFQPALPVLLVLDPAMVGDPWASAVARAASTLQIHDIPTHFDDFALRASFEYALTYHHIERVVVGGEGVDTPLAGPSKSFFDMVRGCTRIVRSLRSPISASLPVDGIWYDRIEDLFLEFRWGDGGDKPIPMTPCSPLLRVLMGMDEEPVVTIESESPQGNRPLGPRGEP